MNWKNYLIDGKQLMNDKNYRICKRGLWDTSVTGITFDENGICNYEKLHDELVKAYPIGEKGLRVWESIVEQMKQKGKK